MEKTNFSTPCQITPACSKFIAKIMGYSDITISSMARTTMILLVSKYIKDNNLKDVKNNLNTFKIDKELSQIFRLPVDSNLSYFALCGYINQHCIIKKKNNTVDD